MSKNKTETVIELTEKQDIQLEDLMAAVAFLGYAVNKFEDVYVPEGQTLGSVVSRESYAWARAMINGKNNQQ